MSLSFAVVGAGKVGSAVARLLGQEDYRFLGAASRSIESARKACDFAGAGEAAAEAPFITHKADLVFLTTPDDAIADTCRRLAAEGGFREGQTVAHCSGALPSTILEPAREAGAHIGSMHPLQSFATAEQALKILPGSYCCIEGDPEAVEVLEGVADALGCPPMTIPTEGKTLYHAAAVVACNFLVALEDAAVEVDGAAGIGREEALQSLMPLIKGTVNNLEAVGLAEFERLRPGDARQLGDLFPADHFDAIVTNPPFGARLGRRIRFADFYADFLDAAHRVLAEGGRLTLLAREHGALHRALTRTGGFRVRQELPIETSKVFPTIYVLERRD